MYTRRPDRNGPWFALSPQAAGHIYNCTRCMTNYEQYCIPPCSVTLEGRQLLFGGAAAFQAECTISAGEAIIDWGPPPGYPGAPI
jgi:hypothetical protein